MLKIFTLFIVVAFLSSNSFAQPTNDTPCTANVIAVDAGFVSDSTIDATVDIDEVLLEGVQGPATCYISWCDGPTLDGTAWWTFVAPANGAVVVTTCSEFTDFDTQIALWTSSDCADYATYEFVAANDDMPEECGSGGSIWASTLNVDGLTPGATYYIQLDGFDGESGYYDISVATGTPSTRINFVHNSADQTIQMVDIRINNELVADDIEFQTCTGYIDVIAGDAMYITICDASSTDDSNPLFSTTADISDVEDYVAMVYGIHAETGYSPAPPLQLNLFEGALINPTTPGFNDILFFHGSTDAPVVDAEVVELGNVTIINNSASGSFASEGYIAVGSLNYTVELNDENGNPLGLSYCAPFSQIGGNFALTIVASGFLDPSQNSDGLPFGLYIVDHFNGVFFPLEMGPCPVAANDVPCNAIELIVNDAPFMANNEWATIDQGETSPPNLDINDPEADCLTQWCDAALNNSVWFRFMAPASGNALISTCHDITFDTQVAVYTVTSCDDYTSFTYLAANDDADGGCNAGSNFASILQMNGLTGGAEYYIQVDGWGGEGGDFEITVEDAVGVYETNAYNWSMYPNPADQNLQFNGVPLNAMVNIFDLTGKQIKSARITSNSGMDVSDLASGVYTVQIVHNGLSSNGKLIIE